MNINTKRPYKHTLSKQEHKSIFPNKRVTDPEEIKAYYRKKLYELSLKSIGEIPRLEKPNEEQRKWVNRKIKHSESSWRSHS
jgi:hypothetical protein